MSLGRLPLRWHALTLAVVSVACRGRTPPTVDWKPRAGVRAEAAPLLLLDTDGSARVVCLPDRSQSRRLFPGVALERVLDVAWRGGPLVAGWALPPDHADPGSGGELMLLAPEAAPRRLAGNVRTARFSPDAKSLAYEVVSSENGPAGMAVPISRVLDLTTGKVAELGTFADPLWEADGKHLRGTRLRPAGDQRRAQDPGWISLRARWDRESGTMTVAGRGSAQVPAPAGGAVAWSEEQRRADAPNHCAVFLNPRGGVMHSIAGRFCAGIADDRAVRWAPDGRHLAFPHPGPVRGLRKPGGFFVDVVSVEGGRYPALSALSARARPEQLAIATAPGLVWFDWSPSGRFLVVQDGASDLSVYDFGAQGLAFLGKGQRPTWSPGGAYLLILAAGDMARTRAVSPNQPGRVVDGTAFSTFVLSGASPAERIGLGPVRDARWLPAQACGQR